MFDEAARVIVTNQQGSASLLCPLRLKKLNKPNSRKLIKLFLDLT